MSISLPLANQSTRIAVVDRELCNPQKCALECMRACPINRQNKPCIAIDPIINKAVIDEDLCIGCRLCVPACPFEAIRIVNLPKELAQNPVHQFFKNSFRLYKLPTPKHGNVLALVGRNGVGKTTALKILTGNLIPNLGNYSKPGDYAAIIKQFRGKELQTFFTQAKEKKLSFSFKPQIIDKIPEQFKGKVRDLLKKTDERKELEKLAKELQIDSILDNQLSELSGGELQRVAIAATLLKESSAYFLDEPTSYLDVKQRLIMAGAVRKIAENGKIVVVVEHDLAVLDYLADYVNVFFGEPAVYGVVSETRSSKNGVNEFLAGYLKTENVRIRKKELKFSINSNKQEKKTVFLAYPSLEKTFSNFKLTVDEGRIMRGEVVAVVGANGIGKSTFVKMLAGVEKSDNDSMNFKLKVSYKPQYLKTEENITVNELLFREKIDFELFRTEFEQKLDLHKFLEKKLDTLSGGELQKVAIAVTLCKPCDLVLLDEPTAFIDIEDRLVIADILRHIAFVKDLPILVVDHDILFQDYVADRIMVFDGIPSRKGQGKPAQELIQGMNDFLKTLDITFRRDPESGRLRANKPGSLLDLEQKKANQYYALH
ncbi:MAG: ribosome biogenesis/translation initiation ATPase RLI [Candidatus Diapherotrites archaeon]|nr:ribosome biogenesis/translation initiation ATPase RLI [Candidatus Diapherotrites archaeon]